MSPDRVSRLEALGIAWDPLEALWNERFQELREFHRTNGHCNVPPRYRANPQLGNWVTSQRRQRRLGKLSHERIALLERFGFRWNQR